MTLLIKGEPYKVTLIKREKGTHGFRKTHGILMAITIKRRQGIVRGYDGMLDGLFTLALGACLRVYNPEHDLLR